MNKNQPGPKTLRDAITYFADHDVALAFVRDLRWPDGVQCIACESKDVGFLKTRRIWKCRECGRQFSVKLGTIFEDSPIGLDKWLPALWLLANCKNGISSYELARDLGVTQKTAWFMLHRVRLAMQSRTFKKMRGEVEADETFIGGAAKFMHKSKRRRVIRGTGGMDKTPVFGLLNRSPKKGESKAFAVVVKNLGKRILKDHVKGRVVQKSKVYTDALWTYKGLDKIDEHAAVDHAVGYVNGKVHTNGLENFWSLLKRTIKGTYVGKLPRQADS